MQRLTVIIIGHIDGKLEIFSLSGERLLSVPDRTPVDLGCVLWRPFGIIICLPGIYSPRQILYSEIVQCSQFSLLSLHSSNDKTVKHAFLVSVTKYYL